MRSIDPCRGGGQNLGEEGVGGLCCFVLKPTYGVIQDLLVVSAQVGS